MLIDSGDGEGTRFLARNTCSSNFVSAKRHGSSCLGKPRKALLFGYPPDRNLVARARTGHTKIAGTCEAAGSTQCQQFKHPDHKHRADIVIDTVYRRRTDG